MTSERSPRLSSRLEAFDLEDIATYLLVDQLFTATLEERERARDEFRDVVEELWTTYEGEFREYYPDLYQANVDADHERTGHALAEFLEKRLEQLREKEQNSWFFGPSEGDIETRETDMARLQEIFQHWQEFDDRLKAVRHKRREEYKNMLHRADEISESMNILHDVQANIRAERDRLESSRRERVAWLEEFGVGADAQIPLTNVTALTPETVAEWVGFERGGEGLWEADELDQLREEVHESKEPSINTLANARYIDEEAWTEIVHAVLDAVEEPVEDRWERDVDTNVHEEWSPDRASVSGLLSVLASEANAAVPDRRVEIQEAALENGYFDNTSAEIIQIRDGSTIRLLGIYGDIDLPLTSEFGQLHEYHLDRERTISEVFFGEGDRLESLDDHLTFAYPELVHPKLI